jgi:hypothetical protein
VSVRQGEAVSTLLTDRKLPWNKAVEGDSIVWSPSSNGIYLPDGMRVTVLSPRDTDLRRLASAWTGEHERSGSAAAKSRARDSTAEQDDALKRRGILLINASGDESWAREICGRGIELSGERKRWSLLSDLAIPVKELEREWRDQIARARVAVVLLSPKALASAYMREQLPAILSAAEEGLRVTWVLVADCDWRTSGLERYQAASRVDQPLDRLGTKEREQAIQEIARKLIALDEASFTEPRSARPITDGAKLDVEALATSRFIADKGVANAASIAFLAEFHDRSLLIGGDAQAEVLCESIRTLLSQRRQSRLHVDAFVLPHAGSARNLNRELLELLACDRYLISTDGTAFMHPDRETVARIIMYGRASTDSRPVLVFNYRTRYTEIWADPSLQERYRYDAVYPASGLSGIKVQI